jgi:hypothetical protein
MWELLIPTVLSLLGRISYLLLRSASNPVDLDMEPNALSSASLIDFRLIDSILGDGRRSGNSPYHGVEKRRFNTSAQL